jgi:ABC-type transport system involved in cytochrome c biogenesis ATPase subunit
MTNLDEAGRLMTDSVAKRHVERGGLLIVATNDAEEAARHPLQLDIGSFRRLPAR